MNRTAVFLLLLLLACSRQGGKDSLVLVNGESVDAAELNREMILLGSRSPDRARALEDLIDQALILQEGRRLGISLSPEEFENQIALARAGTPVAEFKAALLARGIGYDEWRERLRRRALSDEVVRRQIRSKIFLKPQDLKDYYWEHVTRFRRSESVKLRQVFCKSRAAAEKALAELSLGEPMGEVARRYSKAPEAAAGGDLGWVQQAALPKVLGKAAFALKKGKFSGIIASAYGWHILFVEDRRPAEALGLDKAAPEIRESLINEREQPLYRDWLAALRSKADIKRIETKKGTP